MAPPEAATTRATTSRAMAGVLLGRNLMGEA
jgi:hypothetical protein